MFEHVFEPCVQPEQLVEEGQLLSLCWELVVHLDRELEEDVPGKMHLKEALVKKNVIIPDIVRCWRPPPLNESKVDKCCRITKKVHKCDSPHFDAKSA